MKRITCVLIAIILAITLAGCGGNNQEGEAKTPSGSSAQKGRTYQEVIDDFKGQGFKNIKTEKLDDLITGWLTKEGEVESVSVDGHEDYSPDVWYPNDTEVVIKYHTFQEDKNSEETEKNGSGQNDQKADAKILTVENNKDLAKLFGNGEDVKLCKEFVAKYKGSTIEFDGNIADMAPHGNYDTRYDFLIYAGDYSKDSSNGSPAMQFKDVNVSDLHLTGDHISEAIGKGDNLHITATVDDIVNDYLIILSPISTEIR